MSAGTERRRDVEILTTVPGLRDALRSSDEIGLVPTMGALHEGHLSLMQRSARENELTVATLFVNPTQFGPGEDFAKYPRTFDEDARLAASAGAGVLFAPEPAEVYPPGDLTRVSVEQLSDRLCGKFRPGHFEGVATVVTKLFLMVGPRRAYFGEKDFQQLQVIRRLTEDLHFPIQIIACPTVREADGLALSSRNRYLDRDEREAAGAIPRALEAARLLAESGERDANSIVAAAATILADEPLLRLQYLELVDPATLLPVQSLDDEAVLAVALYCGATRLIDNVRILHGLPAA